MVKFGGLLLTSSSVFFLTNYVISPSDCIMAARLLKDGWVTLSTARLKPRFATTPLILGPKQIASHLLI